MKEDCKVADALKLVRREITKLAPQVSCHQRGGMNRVEYLCNAFIGHLWPIGACSMTSVGELGYQEFYNQLEAGILQELEERAGRLRVQRNIP